MRSSRGDAGYSLQEGVILNEGESGPPTIAGASVAPSTGEAGWSLPLACLPAGRLALLAG